MSTAREQILLKCCHIFTIVCKGREPISSDAGMKKRKREKKVLTHVGDLNTSNHFRVVRICIRMLGMSFECLEFAFECFETLTNGSNLHSNDSNPYRMFRICITILRITFESLEFAFECFESLSNASIFHSNASNPFKWFEFTFECFEFVSNASNLYSNALKHFRMIRIWIRMLRIPFE